MNILHARYAVTVAKTGSLSKASEELLVAQPNLSRAIRDLESDLGITIFRRTPKGMVVTPDGEEFLQRIRHILSQFDKLDESYHSTAPVRRTFSVSVPRASYIADAFSEFACHIGHEPVDIYYKETNALRAIRNITDADYTLGIIRYSTIYDKYFREMLEEKGLRAELISRFRYRLVFSKDSVLAGKEHITSADLLPLVEIAHADPYVPFLRSTDVIRAELPKGVMRRIFVYERASQFELLHTNPETFMWVSPMPAAFLARMGLMQKDADRDGRIYQDMLICRKEHQMTALEQTFLKELYRAREKYCEPMP